MITFLLMLLNTFISYKAYEASKGSYSEFDKFIFKPYQLSRGNNFPGVILSHFSHVEFMHFLFNMITLYYFGRAIEAISNSVIYLGIYILSGIGATAFTYVRRKDDPSYRALGASGCVSGIIFAAIVLFPQMNLYMMFIPIPIPAPIFGVLYVLFSAYFMDSNSGIGHDAHLGGAIVGFIAGGILAGGYAGFVGQLYKIFGY